MLGVIVPTTSDRREVYGEFLDAWQPLIEKHNALLVTIFDGDNQYLLTQDGFELTAQELLDKDWDLIAKKDTACKNLGLYYLSTRSEIDTIVILDDDVRPIGDTIQDHLDILRQPVATSWLSTASEYMRGFPYGIRDEATVALSHGVWEGVPDFDAPTQLIQGIHKVYYPKVIVPKNVLFPMCGMNIAITREALPYLYFAPPWREMARCDDIFAGINLKREFDQRGLAVATGYAKVKHERASNVFTNLHKEGLFIKLNENYWTGDNSHEYFIEYESKLKRWQELLLP